MRIGIVITVWNCHLPAFPYYIDNIFSSLSSQDVDAKVDVLFVDNQSSNAFLSGLHNRCADHSNDKISFSYISEKEYHYHFSSMNLGFFVLNNHAHYDVFCYSADDVHFSDPTGLSKAIEEFSDPEVALVSSRDNFDNAPPFYPCLTRSLHKCPPIKPPPPVTTASFLFMQTAPNAYYVISFLVHVQKSVLDFF